MRHGILYFLQWPQKHLAQHHMRSSFPHHVHNKENGYLYDLKGSYKRNVIPQGLKDGKNPT
jgi:hypothetical protein